MSLVARTAFKFLVKAARTAPPAAAIALVTASLAFPTAGGTMNRRTILSPKGAVLTCTMLLVAACSDARPSTPTEEERGEMLKLSVTPGVAVTADSSRARLRLDDDALRGSSSEISGAQARAFAAFWLRKFAAQQRGVFEEDGGRPIDPRRLVPCRAPRYAAPTFEPLGVDASKSDRINFGPWWVVPVCDESELRGMLAVSSLISPNAMSGDHLTSEIVGNEFQWAGVSVDDDDWPITAPEGAVIYAASVLKTRIAETPRLIAPPLYAGGVRRAVWRVTLEHPVRVPGADEETLQRVVYIGGVTRAAIPTGFGVFLPDQAKGAFADRVEQREAVSGGRRFAAVSARRSSDLPLVMKGPYAARRPF